MKLQRLFLITASVLTFTIQAKAQLPEGFKAEVEVQAIGTTNKVVPFWMRANQYGSIPLNGASGSLLGGVSKDYASFQKENKKLLDWGFGLDGRANAGNYSNLTLVEAYVKAKASIFQLKIGRSKDVTGLNGDTILSSGNFAVSGNSLGVPKIELSIPEYWRVPIFGGLISIKGNFSHGWVGSARVNDILGTGKGGVLIRSINNNPQTYLHQKSFYGRLGKENWKIRLVGGFNHQVYWGNEDEIYGKENFKLSSLQTFTYVTLGRAYGGTGYLTERSKIGNQIGSIDLGIELELGNSLVRIYRQNFYDVGALAKLANITDGLNGISIENLNLNENKSGFKFKKVLVEFIYSKDQAGYPWSKPTKSGDENYYNNYYYVDGWSYSGLGLGNPFITKAEDAKSGQASRVNDYFINNRIAAFHVGINGSVRAWDIISKVSYSWNYGTFGTSKYGISTGTDRGLPSEVLFVPVQQLSFLIEGTRHIKDGYYTGFNIAIDQGQLLNNSMGIGLKLKKVFN